MTPDSMDQLASQRIIGVLEEADARTEELLDSLPGVFLLVNEEFEILRANIASCELFDSTQEGMLRRSILQLFNSDAQKIFRQHIASLFQGKAPHCDFELAITREDQLVPWVWILSRVRVRSGSEGNLFTVQGRDISKQREHERRIKSIFTSIPIALFLVGKDGIILPGVSEFGKTLLGVEMEEKPFLPLLLDHLARRLEPEEIGQLQTLVDLIGAPVEQYKSTVVELPSRLWLRQDSDAESKILYTSLLMRPIIVSEKVQHVMVLMEDKSEEEAARLAREQAELMERQNREIYEKAVRDALTGLYNRQYMQDSIGALVQQAQRGVISSLSMVIIDLDHFKRVNDTYGHQAGDAVLRHTGSLIIETARRTDIPIRYGGEEFMVFLPGPLSAAIALAERLLEKTRNSEVLTAAGPIRFTLSAGIATLKEDEELADFIRRADEALYQSKQNGRNQYTVGS